jgi:hypothetical protein
MANNAFNFKGIYDKIAGLLKNDAIVQSGDYTPSSNDYVAVYKDVPGSPGTATDTIAVKQYVSVTDIGTGGGGGGGGSMSSFEVSGAGGVTLSLNGGAYSAGPLTIDNLDELAISATSVPSGLNWEGQWSNSTTYQLNDVVSNVAGSVYTTWFYINATPSSGNALPTGGATSNTYWAQLGTQGPPGAQGPAGIPNAMATYGFKSVNRTATYTSITVSGTPGDGTNDVGKIFLLNNTTTTNGEELVVTINTNLNGTDPATSGAGWPWYSQITFMNITGISLSINKPVKIVGAAGVTINSADGANYLRTQYSTCSIVRRSANEYYMFGDLTNIA